jgi:outer membrane protein assembly factor BamA
LIPDLNENNISYLNREEFASNLHLLNLQKIYIKQSKVKHVHKEAFKNLKILVEIDLSENEIETIDKQTFAGKNLFYENRIHRFLTTKNRFFISCLIGNMRKYWFRVALIGRVNIFHHIAHY